MNQIFKIYKHKINNNKNRLNYYKNKLIKNVKFVIK